MRTTLATIVLGLPYIAALLLFVLFKDLGTGVIDPTNNLVWVVYLGALAAGYSISTFYILDRDDQKTNIPNDFISCFWPYVMMMGLIEAEPRFRHAFDVMWMTRTDGPLLFQSLGLVFIPCFVAFATIQMMMDPDLGTVDVNLSKVRI